ncbi:MAG: hypothetical protein WD712_02920 [Candidatus Spechtbacterales bacterium]
MSKIFEKIMKFLTGFWKHLPFAFAQNSQKIFWAVMVIVLVTGAVIFYFKTYVPMTREYEVFVTVRKVNQTLLDQVFEYIMEKGESDGLLPIENPFEP